MKARLVLLALIPICLLASVLAALRMAWAVVVAPTRAWMLVVAYDELGNVVFNGVEGETISSRAAKAAKRGRRWGCVLCRLLDALDPGHCEKSIQPGRGAS